MSSMRRFLCMTQREARPLDLISQLFSDGYSGNTGSGRCHTESPHTKKPPGMTGRLFTITLVNA